MKARLVRSANGVSWACDWAWSLPTTTDSPVRLLSSISRPWLATSRPSAGTRSPASISTRSPGTSCSAGISCLMAPRRTLDCGASMDFSVSRMRSARYSWWKPRAALNSTTTMITSMSVVSPMNPASRPAPSSTMVSRLWNCSATIRALERALFSGSRLGPWRASRAAASSAARPAWRWERSRAQASSALNPCHDGCSLIPPLSVAAPRFSIGADGAGSSRPGFIAVPRSGPSGRRRPPRGCGC